MNTRTLAVAALAALGIAACGKSSGPDTSKGPDMSSTPVEQSPATAAPDSAQSSSVTPTSSPPTQSASAAPQRGTEEGASHNPGAAGQNTGCDVKGMDTANMSAEERERTLQNCNPQNDQRAANPAAPPPGQP